MSMPNWCRRGQKVVCLVGKGNWDVLEIDRRGTNLPFPQLGLVYTISGVAREGGWIGLELVELEADTWFGHAGFAPAVEDDTEAALFRALKHPSSGASRHLLPQGEKGRRRVLL